MCSTNLERPIGLLQVRGNFVREGADQEVLYGGGYLYFIILNHGGDGKQ